MSVASTGSCSSLVEDVFGPVTSPTCLDGFDFTLLFEESILDILPSGIAVLWAFLRLCLLWRQPTKVRRGALLPMKLVTYAAQTALQIALLVVWGFPGTTKTRLTYTTLGISLGGTLLLAVVSYMEHRRSARPSTFLVLYLGLSLLLDLPRVRTTWFLPGDYIIASLITSSASVKCLTFLLELVEKRYLLLSEFAEPSPEATSSIVNRALLVWINPLFWAGLQKTLAIEELLPLDRDILDASRSVDLLEEWQNIANPHKDALLLIFIRHFKWSILRGVVPRLCRTGFLFAQPFLVQRVLSFMTEKGAPNRKEIGYSLVAAYALVYIGIAMVSALYEYYTNRVMTEFRGSLVSLIGRKTLRICPSRASESEAITLMSADIDRIRIGVHLLHESYASLIELGLSLWLLFNLIGISMAASTVWLVISLGLGVPIAIIAGNAQVPWLEAIEERLAVTTKALAQIMPVKMAGLAAPVSDQIAFLRNMEIRASLRYRLMTAMMTSATFLSSSLTPVVGLGAFILIARAHGTYTLTPDIAFAALTLFSLQQQPATFLLTVFEDFQIVINCFRRIQDYLLSEELEDYRCKPTSVSTLNDSSNLSQDSETSVDAKSLHGDKDQEGQDDEHVLFAVELAEVSVSYSPEREPVIKNVSITIPTGKTTVILGPVASGKSTLLKLILGELQPSSGAVTCAFSQAAYSAQTPWIMAGTIRSNIVGMSAWDPSWYERVVNACALQRDFEELPQGDHCVAGPRGSRLSGGQKTRVSLARALYSRLPVIVLDSALTGLDSTTEKSVADAVFGPNGILAGSGITVILASISDFHASLADHVIRMDDRSEKIQQGANRDSAMEPKLSDQSPPTSVHSDEDSVLSGDVDNESTNEEELFESIPGDDDMGTSRKASDFAVYAFYLRAVGFRLILVYFIACATYIVCTVFPSIWVQYWTNSNLVNPNNNIGYWLGIYAAIGALTIITSVLSEVLFMLVIIPKTSRRFHEYLLTTTIRATTSFLTSTDPGKTTNRFSQDLELIDNDLPQSFDLFILEAMSTISSTVLIFVGSSYIAASVPVCIAVLYLIQKFYLRTSRQLRLLDIEAKAPLFSHFLETLHGAASIRAYNWTDQFLERYLRALDDSQRPYYLMDCIQLWLTLVLDLLVAGLAILLVGLALNLDNGSTNFLGVALLNIVDFSTTLQSLIQQWTSLETSIGAVSRVRAYIQDTTPEDRDDEPEPVDEDWPSRGAVSLEHVYASFDTSDQPVLQDITLDIRAGEKVAICGRTGSGKSSLVSAILNLLNIKAGSISIDDVQISKVERQLLRTRLGTLPQDGVIMAGSVRDNLNPPEGTTDERVIEVLRKLQLWKVFEEQAGLDGELSEDLLSHGQKQLFCLARAIIKRSRVLLMDEATSSIDSEFDELTTQIIRDEFQDYTVIAVAHKLQSILDFDRVVVMGNGRILESGRPRQLLEDPKSAFKALYSDTAAGNASS